MRKKSCRDILCLFVLLLAPAAGSQETVGDLAAWVNEGRWPRGPKAVEATPQKQFEKAQRLEDIGDVRQASEQFKRLATIYPGADYITDAHGAQHNYAEEGRLRAARNYLAAGNYAACKEQLDELRRLYVRPSYLDLMGQVETNLARGYLDGRGEGGTYQLSSRARKARRIFQHILDEDPQGRWAADALLGLGQCAEAIGDYDGAIKQYKTLLEKYPDSELRGEAEARIAFCLDRREPLPRHTEAEAVESQQRIQRLREEAQASKTEVDLAALAESEKQLLDRQAHKLFDQAGFYSLNSHYRAAEVYYELIKAQFPESEWAKKADGELARLRRR